MICKQLRGYVCWVNPSHDWDLNRDLITCGDSIWTIKIRFKRPRSICDLIWIFAIRFEKELNRDKSAACLPTRNRMYESSKHFCFGCNLTTKLHQWMIMFKVVSTVTVPGISCAIRPKIHCVKHCYLDFPSKIYLHIFVEVLRFDLKFDLEIFGFLGKMGIWDMVEWFKSISWKVWDLSSRFDLKFARHWLLYRWVV